MTRSLFVFLALLGAASVASAAFVHHPDMHGSTMIFASADELWITTSSADPPRRLTALPGKKLWGKISPDGKLVAFTAFADGNFDVYVVPVTGGSAKRLTYNPSLDFVVGWTPDGASVLFTSRRSSFTHPDDKLFTVACTGGAAIQLPLERAGPASFAPDGRQIAYNRNPITTWNPPHGYRGGRHATIAIYDFDRRTQIMIPNDGSNDMFPMWSGSTIYFTSDREGRFDLYAYSLSTLQVRRLTHHGNSDVRNASRSPVDGRIVYEINGELYVFDTKTLREERRSIVIGESFPELAKRTVNLAPYISSIAAHVDDMRAIVCARGELLDVDALQGRSSNLTRTSGIREHSAVVLADGATAYVSDETGEYQIYLRRQDNPPRRLTSEPTGFRFGLTPSPDGTRILFVDQTQALNLVSVDGSGIVTTIDRSRFAPIDSYTWTRDGTSVLYAKTEANRLNRIYRYSISRGMTEPLTDGVTEDFAPAEGESGDVCFLSARNFRPSFSDFEQTFNFNDSIGLYVRHSNDIVDRMPIGFGSLSRLSYHHGLMLYLNGDVLHAFDVATSKDETLSAGVRDYSIAGTSLVVWHENQLTWYRLAGGSATKAHDFSTDKLTAEIDPKSEWRQIFDDAWRFARDYFHDPALHGVDWSAVRKQYKPLVNSVGSRDDLNYVLTQMLADLGTSHSWAVDGDVPQFGVTPVGVLGCDFAIENGRYIVASIYRGDDASEQTRGPLFQKQVSIGDAIVAVNGHPITSANDIHEFLRGTVGKPTTLTIAPNRDIVVIPTADDMAIRYADWVRGNRELVQRSCAQCAYIHVPNTGRSGIAAFARQFFAQVGRTGVIVDVRWNSGGLFPSAMIEHLRRVKLGSYASRNSDDISVPGAAIYGPKVLLTNANTVSGGDAFAIYFREARLGPIVGERTAGATVGNVGMPGTIDNGEIGVAALGYRPDNVQLEVENVGLVPDVTVERRVRSDDDDRQLTAAIALLKSKRH